MIYSIVYFAGFLFVLFHYASGGAARLYKEMKEYKLNVPDKTIKNSVHMTVFIYCLFWPLAIFIIKFKK